MGGGIGFPGMREKTRHQMGSQPGFPKNEKGDSTMTRLRMTLVSGFLLVLQAGANSTTALAQAVAGAQIRGAITDSTGAVVPHAPVNAIQTSTGVRHSTVSNDSGT